MHHRHPVFFLSVEAEHWLKEWSAVTGLHMPSQAAWGITFTYMRSGESISIINNFNRTVWVINTRAPSQYKDGLSRYGNSHYKDKTVKRPTYLYNWNLHTGNMTSLCCNGPQRHILITNYTSCCKISKSLQSHDWVFKCSFALKSGGQLCSHAEQMPTKFQSNWKTLNNNCIHSRHANWWWDVLCDADLCLSSYTTDAISSPPHVGYLYFK